MVRSYEPDVGHGNSGVLFPNTRSAYLMAAPQRGPGDWMQAGNNPQPLASVW